MAEPKVNIKKIKKNTMAKKVVFKGDKIQNVESPSKLMIPSIFIPEGNNKGMYLQCMGFVLMFLDGQSKLTNTPEEMEYLAFLAKEILEINGVNANFTTSIPDSFQKLKGVDGIRVAEGKGGRYFNIQDLLDTMKDHFQKARNPEEKGLIQHIATQLAQITGVKMEKGGIEKINNAGKIIDIKRKDVN